MKSLALKFILRNKKKSLIIMFSTIMGIILMILTNMIVSSIKDNVYLAWAKPVEDFSVIIPASVDSQLTGNSILYPIYYDKIFMTGVTGRISTHSFFGSQEAINYIFEINNGKILDGRMLNNSLNEIVISEEIAKNKDLSIGDYIGKSVDSNEGILGAYEVVGIFSADGIFSLGNAEYYSSLNTDAYEGAIIAPDAQILDEIDTTSFTVISYENEAEDIENYGQILSISMIIILAFVYTIVLFLTAFIVYIFMSQRKKEFGILLAIGYTKREITSSSAIGIFVLNMIGFILGAIVATLGGVTLNAIYFDSWGQNLTVLKYSYFFPPFLLAMFSSLSAYVIAHSIISKVDCIALIENE